MTSTNRKHTAPAPEYAWVIALPWDASRVSKMETFYTENEFMKRYNELKAHGYNGYITGEVSFVKVKLDNAHQSLLASHKELMELVEAYLDYNQLIPSAFFAKHPDAEEHRRNYGGLEKPTEVWLEHEMATALARAKEVQG